MTSCELCGKIATKKAKIEGSVLAVCESCASFGTELKETKPLHNVKVTHSLKADLPETFLVENFGQLLRQARSKKKLTEEDAAKLLNIRESTLKHYEAGAVQPDETTIRKLEKFYGVSLLARL